MISLEKSMILTPLQKLHSNVGDLGKIIVANGFEWLPKKSKISPNLVTVAVNTPFKCKSDKYYIKISPHMQLIAISATRMGDFLKLLPTNYNTKLAQIFGKPFGLVEKHHHI